MSTYKSEMCVCCHPRAMHLTPGMECCAEDCKCSTYDPLDGFDEVGDLNDPCPSESSGT